MKLYLTRQHDGSYMLTRFRPVITEVNGAGYNDAFVQHGEPIGLRHLCAGGIKWALGEELEILETIPVDFELRRRKK